MVDFFLSKTSSSGTLATLPLPLSLQTFFRYFYNALDTFASKMKFLAFLMASKVLNVMLIPHIGDSSRLSFFPYFFEQP